MQTLQPRRVDEPLQGRILQELIYESKTTCQLAAELRTTLAAIRQELIRLHHLGCVEPVAEQVQPQRCRLYFREFLWGLTQHMRDHDTLDPDCSRCRIRERILLKMQIR